MSEEISRSQEITGNAIGKRSEERQIRVYSKNPLIKAHFDAYSRELRYQFRNQLGLFRTDDWQVVYKVFVYGSTKEVHAGNDVITEIGLDPGDQFTIRIKVKVHDRFKEESYRLAFIKMLLIEEMLENYIENPESLADVKLYPPDWMVHGFEHNLTHKELGRPSYFYSGFLKNGQLMDVDSIMKPRQALGLNPLSLQLFKASSAILVGALCDQKNGGESVRGMLKDLAMRPDYEPRSLVRKHFPGFRETGQGLDKWWALQLATLSQQQSFEYYSAKDTDTYLEQAIQVFFKAINTPSASAKKANPNLLERFKGKVTEVTRKKGPADEPKYEGTLEGYRHFLDRKDARQVIADRQSSLFMLRVQAFPLYRDVIDRYTVLCDRLMQNQTEGIDKEFAELRKIREQIQQSLAQTRDYLNYYEATRAPRRSEAFDNYMKFMESIKPGSLPKRTDSISTYMDEVEARMPRR